MTNYVQVLVNLPGINTVFDYHVPQEFQSDIRVGSLVQVVFGKQKVQGVVTGFVETPAVPQTKPIADLLFDRPVVTAHQLELIKWMAKETYCEESTCLQLMLPVGVGKQADSLYSLGSLPANFPLSPLQRTITVYMQEKGALTGRQLDARFRRQDWRRSIRKLIGLHYIQKKAFLAPPSLKPKMVNVARITSKLDEVGSNNPALGRQEAVKDRRRSILSYLSSQPGDVQVQLVMGKTGANAQDLKRLNDAGLIKIFGMESIRDPLADIQQLSHDVPNLVVEQQRAWEQIADIIKKREYDKPIILHGVTGSGKTEIYLRAVQEKLASGKQAIVLVPEISLTPQTVQRFQSRFPGKVGVIHSKLSEGERFDTWRRVLSAELSVIVGPRSALFMPFNDLGIIIMDEAHDDSYFQEDVVPRYSALRTAKAYGRIANAMVIYGSATPGVEMMYRAQIEKWHIFNLPNRILAHKKAIQSSGTKTGQDPELIYIPLPPIRVVDMRTELKSGNKSIFSRILKAELEKVIQDGNQAILFLNRRGTASYVFCRDCGYRVDCPRCDLGLTYHADKNLLICHHCNYQRQMPQKCPACGSVHIRQFGLGTERVEQEVKRLLPSARVIRLDSGVVQHKGAHASLLSQFANRQADILVGTQMLAKGIDLPHVTLVGVLLAEIGLGLPDFRSAERTFQLLTQVAGRAGRSPLGGKAIFQTYQPDHYAIQMASHHDFSGFYQQEIEKRRNMDYPPFSRLIKLEFRSRDESEAQQDCQKVAQDLQLEINTSQLQKTELIGPVPCFFSRMAGMFRWQVIIRGPHPISLLSRVSLGTAIVTIDPVSLL